MAFNPNIPDPDRSPADQTVDIQNNFIHLLSSSISGSLDVSMVEHDGKSLIAMKFPDDSWAALEPYMDGTDHKVRLVELGAGPSEPYSVVIVRPGSNAITIDSTYSGKVIVWDNAGTLTVSIDLESEVENPEGFLCSMIKVGAGNIDIAPIGVVSFNGASDTITIDRSFSECLIRKIGEDEWISSYYDGTPTPATEPQIKTISLLKDDDEYQTDIVFTKGILMSGGVTWNLTDPAHATLNNTGALTKIEFADPITSNRSAILIAY